MLFIFIFSKTFFLQENYECFDNFDPYDDPSLFWECCKDNPNDDSCKEALEFCILLDYPSSFCDSLCLFYPSWKYCYDSHDDGCYGMAYDGPDDFETNYWNCCKN
jgi:hypothetical protein